MTLYIYYSCSNLANIYNQADGSNSLTSSERQDTSIALNGSYKFMSGDNNISSIVLYPSFSCVLYSNVDYGGTVILDYKNSTNNPIFLTPAIPDTCSSLKLYYNDILIESF